MRLLSQLQAVIGAVTLTVVGMGCQKPAGNGRVLPTSTPPAQVGISNYDVESKVRFRPLAEAAAGETSQADRNLDAQSYMFRWLVTPTEKKVVVDEILVLHRSQFDTVIQLDAGESLAIEGVWVEEQETRFFHEKDNIKIIVPDQFHHETQLKVRFRYHLLGKNSGVNFVTNDNGDVVQIWSHSEPEGARTWFVGIDRPDDKAFYQIEVELPGTWQVLSNGRKITDIEVNGTRTVAWQMVDPMPTYLFSVLMGEFDIHNQEWRGVPLSYWLLPGKKEALKVFEQTPQMLQYFSDALRIGYPFSKYSIGMAIGFGGAMEHTTATTFSDSLVESMDPSDHSAEIVAVHELAHHWFGDTVTCKDWHELWLNESFATFFQARYMAYRYGWGGVYEEEIESFRQRYFSREPQNGSLGPVVNYDSSPEAKFNVISYEKGALVLNMLYEKLGGSAFYAGLRRYLRSHFMANATTSDLMKALEYESGKSLKHFFDQWVYQPGYPELNIELKQEQDQSYLVVSQTQAEPTPLFSFDLPVMLLGPQGDQTRKFWITHRAQKFLLDGDIRGIIVDPSNSLLARWNLLQPASSWRLILTHTLVNDIQKLRAAMALTDELSTQDWWQLYANTKAGEGLRAKALEQYGQHSDANFNNIVDGLKYGPKIRTVVMKVLGRWPTNDRDQEIDDILIEALVSDPIWTVAAEGAHSLAARRSPRAFDALTAELKSQKRRGYLLYEVLKSLGELGDQRSIPLMVPYLKQPHFFVRGTAALALASFTGSELAKEALLGALAVALDYPNFAQWGYLAPKQLLEGLAKIGGDDVKQKVIEFSQRADLPGPLRGIANKVIAHWESAKLANKDPHKENLSSRRSGSMAEKRAGESYWGSDGLDLVDIIGPTEAIHRGHDLLGPDARVLHQ